MRSARYVLAAVAACLLTAGPATAAGYHRARKAQAPQPSSVELLRGMVTAADEWWSLQGSPPPCPDRADVQWGVVVAGYSEFAYYDSCVIALSPHWWATQYAYLTGTRKRSARIRAAAYDLALLMHARGHNLGYRHIPGTVMQEDTPVVPGWAFEWAGRTVR